MTCSKFRFPV